MDKKKPVLDFKKLTPEQFKIAELVVEAAEANGVDPNLLLAQAFRESGFRHIPSEDPNSDAFGVMQIRPSTGELNKLGDTRDLRTNVYGGAKLMRQYIDKYKSPEAALLAYHQGPGIAETYINSKGDLKAVGPKGLDYVIDIGNNGGFGQPAKAEGDGESSVEPNRYEAYQSEATKLKKEQEARDEEARLNPPPPKPKTLLDSAIESANKIDPEYAALVGAGANAVLPMLTETPKISPKIDTTKAETDEQLKRKALSRAQTNLQQVAPQGVENLEETFRQSQGELERLKNEQRLTQERLKGMPKTAPVIEPPPPSSLISQIDLTRTGPASGPKIEGDSGPRNWTIKAAGQKHQMPEAVLDMVTDQTGTTKTGGMTLIRQDLENLEKIKQLGMGDSKLVTTAGGLQIQLPATSVAERQAEIDQQTQANQAELAQRAEQARLQQEAQAQQLEQQRLANEADLERVRQERAQLGQRHNVLTGQIKATNPYQSSLRRAQESYDAAADKLDLARQQPNAAGRVLERAGVATTGPSKAGALPRAFAGAGATYLGVMSYQEALQRFNAGDTSEGVLKALQAGSAAASMLPPAGKGLTKARGAGALGMVGTYGYEGARRLFKDRPPE